ncbi:MAG: HAD family hydrolase [Acidobacteriaceae bacterium]|nr:HAD family hydrolase [Acidobacteriaceae bacterium]
MAEIQAQGLLFDMDGVLVSSIASAERCWQIWAKHYGMPNWSTFKIPHGVRAMDLVKQFAPNEDPVEALKFIEDLEVNDVEGIDVLPGARALLESLPLDRWTIVTSASTRLMEARVKAANLPLPKSCITADMVQKGKPDPEPYRKGAELLGFAPEHCIVVEDAPSGIQAGHAAGARVLGVVSSHTAEQVAQSGADWVVASLESAKLLSSEGGLRLSVTTV